MEVCTPHVEESFDYIEIKVNKTQCVDFKVNSEGVLKRIMNFGDRVDVNIPSVLPDGTRIKAIDTEFCWGLFGTVTISNDITEIRREAFGYAKVHEVVWQAACTKVPELCFFMSGVRKIHNLNEITDIEDYAFWGAAELKEVDISSAPISFVSHYGLLTSCPVRLPYYFLGDIIVDKEGSLCQEIKL